MENARFTSNNYWPNWNGYPLLPSSAIDGVTVQNVATGDVFTHPAAGSNSADLLMDVKPAEAAIGVLANYANIYPRTDSGLNRFQYMVVIINENLASETYCSPNDTFDTSYVQNAINENKPLVFDCTGTVNAETVTVRNTVVDNVSVVELQLGYKE